MRPTNLKFRSPKETTPAGYYPMITSNGSKLDSRLSPKRMSFAKSPRFTSYKFESAKVGFRVGPSSYEQKIPFSRIKGGFIYKSYFGSSDVGNNGYYYTGNHIVYNPALTSKARRHSSDHGNLKGTPRNIIFKTNSSHRHSRSLDEDNKVNKLSPQVKSPRNRPINSNIFD